MRPIALLFALIAAPCGDSARAEEDAQEVAGPFPWTRDADTVFLRRVVSAATGLPIAGASARLFAEVLHPLPDLGTPLAVGTSGADGWVRISRADFDREGGGYLEPDWAYIEAPGFGVEGIYKPIHESGDFALKPVAEMRVTLLDSLSRPIVGALVGMYIGCGHMPDLRQALTDERGMARLAGCAPGGNRQIWFNKVGFCSDNMARPWWPWERELPHWASWGITVEGTVLRHDGSPEPHIAIGRHAQHRGPWTRSGADGRFRLLGMDGWAGDTVTIEAHGLAGDSEAYAGPPIDRPMPPTGFPLIVRLPPAGEPFREPERTARLVVEAPRPEGTDAENFDIDVTVVRESDGWTDQASVGEQGVALLSVPPGRFRVFADGISGTEVDGISAGRGEASVEVPTTGGAYVAVSLPPVVELVLETDFQFAGIELLREGETDRLAVREPGVLHTVHVPRGQSIWLKIAQNGSSRIRQIPASFLEPGSAPYRIPPLGTVRVAAALVDPEGRPARGWLVNEDALGDEHAPQYPAVRPAGEPSGTPVMERLEGDRVDLVAWPEDVERLQPVRLARRALAARAEPVDLGRVQFPLKGLMLSVLGLDGRPLEEARVRVTRGVRTGEPARRGDGFADPWDEPGLVGPGAIVRVEGWARSGERDDGTEEWYLPFWSRLEGDGPWAVAPPKGSLELEFDRTQESPPLKSPTLHIDGTLHRWPKLPVRYVGLLAGSHEVVIEAEGMHAQRLRFTLREGEERRWTVRLRPTAVEAPR